MWAYHFFVGSEVGFGGNERGGKKKKMKVESLQEGNIRGLREKLLEARIVFYQKQDMEVLQNRMRKENVSQVMIKMWGVTLTGNMVGGIVDVRKKKVWINAKKEKVTV